MTTIAVRKYGDRIELAADTQANDDDNILILNKIFSLHSLHKNFIFAHAGNRDKSMLFATYIKGVILVQNLFDKDSYCVENIFLGFREWLADHNIKIANEESERFIIIYKMDVYDVRLSQEDLFFVRKIEEQFFAIGCGGDFALAAMECGKTPKEAVEIAAKFTVNTGGEIQEELIKVNGNL